MILNGPIKGYLLHDTGVSFKLCKILNEYDNKADAKTDLLKLLADEKTEKGLLKEYSKKDIFGITNG